MAWPPLKLELHLLLQPVGYCYFLLRIHRHVICSLLLLRLLLIGYSALVYVIVVSFVALLPELVTNSPHRQILLLGARNKLLPHVAPLSFPPW